MTFPVSHYKHEKGWEQEKNETAARIGGPPEPNVKGAYMQRQTFAELLEAIGFDLFNTLITADTGAVDEALRRLITALHQNGFAFEDERFKTVYRESALQFIQKARKDGKETHNRFWISTALEDLGCTAGPGDERIAASLDAYFSAFLDYCRLIPGTLSLLKNLKTRYRLGLLSNFTHAPACRQLMEVLGLTPFFDVVLISGDLGYRKPHPLTFDRLVDALGAARSRILYVGDNVDADIKGAVQAGIRPVWFSYARDHKIPLVPGTLEAEVDPPGNDVPRAGNWEEFLAILSLPTAV